MYIVHYAVIALCWVQTITQNFVSIKIVCCSSTLYKSIALLSVWSVNSIIFSTFLLSFALCAVFFTIITRLTCDYMYVYWSFLHITHFHFTKQPMETHNPSFNRLAQKKTVHNKNYLVGTHLCSDRTFLYLSLLRKALMQTKTFNLWQGINGSFHEMNFFSH